MSAFSRRPAGSERIGSRIRAAIALASAVVLVLFVAYEVVERTWLNGVDPAALRAAHIARGLISSLLVAVVVSWWILKKSPALLASSGEFPGSGASVQVGGRTTRYATWFVQMRWLAVWSSGTLVFVSTRIAGLLPLEVELPLALTVAAVAATNLAFSLMVRRHASTDGQFSLQVVLDLIALTILLHFSGGVENPLSWAMAFDVIAAGIMLPRPRAYLAAGAGGLLFAALGLGEGTEMVEHYTLQVFPHNQAAIGHAAHQPLYVATRVVLHAVMMGLTAYFITTLMERIHAAENRLAALANAARDERQLLEQAMNATATGICIVDAANGGSWCSDGWRRRLPLDPCIVPPEGKGPAAGCDAAALRNSATRTILRDGAVRVTEVECPQDLSIPREAPGEPPRKSVLLVTTAALKDPGRGVDKVVELVQDVTVLREAQAQAERAAKLAAIGELCGNIAHEINNPVAIISGKIRLLLSDENAHLSPKVLTELRKVAELCDRVARIAQGLLSSGRPSPGARTRIDIRVPIQKALAAVEERARSANVRLDDRLEAAIPPVVHANDAEMEQVFLNLFLNALDAMPGGGTLRISTIVDPPTSCGGRPSVAVRVADTGAGIRHELQSRIFEPFFTTKPEGRGTGLGLSICQGLVRSHGGGIHVESEPGKGSRFVVTLPRSPAAAGGPIHAAV